MFCLPLFSLTQPWKFLLHSLSVLSNSRPRFAYILDHYGHARSPLVSSYNLRRRSVHTVGVGETGTRHVPINVFHSQICCSEPYLQTEGACTERRADKLTPPPSYTASMLNDHIWQCVSQKSPYFTGTAIPRGCAWSWSW